MYAAALGNIDAFNLVLDSGADVNAANAFDATALMWCADQPDMVRRLLAKGADVNAKSKMGRTPLLIAATYSGNIAVVRMLLAKGANVRVRDVLAATPLLAATAANDLELVKLLLQRGADVNGAKESENLDPATPAMLGLTPLMNAAAAGNAEMVRLLVAHGADVKTVASAKPFHLKNGPLGLTSFTALTLGAAYGGPETIRVLVDHGANVNAGDGRGLNPLMLAVATDRSDARAVRWLLANGADPAAATLSGESAVDWARRFQNPQVLEALNLRANQNAPAVEKSGGTMPGLT
jgi:ankyrin repeat protein